MSRPSSSAASTAPPSAVHKRTKSTPRPSPSTSLQTLYITNLRLLNLDLLPDWPSITLTTFSNADARARIKAVEWSLYQLFRLYDLPLTSDKLQPFFPPLEPLQSVNLRAALYRCLESLKKAGVLGREAVVRKTMLDECSGDKFWEVCLGFSAMVLRKVVLERKERIRPAAQRLGTAQGLGEREREMLEPLILAHKAALRKVVEDKARAREGLERFERVLEEKEGQLGMRRHSVRERGGQGRSQKQVDGLRVVENGIRKKWVGDDAVKESLISGERTSGGDRVLLEATDAFLNRADKPGSRAIKTADIGVLEDVQAKAHSQNLRIRRWQSMYDKLQSSRPREDQAKQVGSTNASNAVQFDKHQDLSLQDMKINQQTMSSPTKCDYATRYDSILTAMREDLRQGHKPGHSTSRIEQHPHKRSATIDSVAGARDSTLSQTLEHSRASSVAQSPSKEFAPFRPGLGRRISSQSKSYHQPKVISQREFIPLKSELFSPLKTTRNGSESRPPSVASSRPGSMFASPKEEFELPSSIDYAINGANTKQDSLSSDTGIAAKIDSAVGLGLHTETTSPQDMEPTKTTPDVITPDFRKPSLSPTSQEAPSMYRPSLAERARMSMAPLPAKQAQIDTDLLDAIPAAPKATNPDISDTIATPVLSLADRTRQSISHFPPPSSAPSALSRKPTTKSKPSHTRTRSSITPQTLYPTNQFDTPPRKTRRSSLGATLEVEEEGTRSRKRDLTPREKLFEENVEYDSVFKSRPRVAVSPSPSPSPFAGKGNGGYFGNEQ